MEKKGFSFLGNETIGIIVAVLCILVLVALGAKLYFTATSNSNLEKAQNNLDKIKLGMEEAKKSGFASVFVLQPTDWVITSFPYQYYAYKPEKCKLDYCVCICEKSCSESDKNYLCIDEKEPINTEDATSEEGVSIIIKNPPVLLKINYNKDRGYTITREKNEQKG